MIVVLPEPGACRFFMSIFCFDFKGDVF